ncbi:hypothetical protein KBC99_01620 [Candidatus Saccharibacteria bacterium]|nr:hypothetical protein [Candidatus Saccharibacteria bacterium]
MPHPLPARSPWPDFLQPIFEPAVSYAKSFHDFERGLPLTIEWLIHGLSNEEIRRLTMTDFHRSTSKPGIELLVYTHEVIAEILHFFMSDRDSLHRLFKQSLSLEWHGHMEEELFVYWRSGHQPALYARLKTLLLMHPDLPS